MGLVQLAGRTSLIVAHRLATVQRCDSVAFLEEGVISEQGPHEAGTRLTRVF